ncbi:MAG: hypothetical protein ABJK28_16500 [Algibacter sp.]
MKPLFSLKKYITIAVLMMSFSLLQAQSNIEKASTIAHKVVKAMGGVGHYNNTRFIKWDFGKRILYWNKWTGDVRIENPKENLVVLVNINSQTGKAFKNKVLITDENKTKKLLRQAKNWWINDSYWLVMPWKLQDPGTTFTYVKEGTLPDGEKADVLQLTFNNVGVTPNNKYVVYVDQNKHLIKQWEFFKNFNDTEPKFSKPWDNYQKAGNILLSFNRSDFGPKNVVVKQEFDSKIFTEL